ncbi:MAG: lysophospholipid acyltransferase family protein [Phycisphaerae bacterium]
MIAAGAVAGLARLITGCRPRWAAPPPNAPCVFYGNHSSHLDGLVIWSSLPGPIRTRCCPVGAADYWQASATRRWLSQRVFNCVLIERKAVTRTNNPLERMVHSLAANNSLILFPEGTRSDGDDTGEFQAGLYHIAKKRPETPFVPVLLRNMNRILPKGEVFALPLIGSVDFGAALQLEHQEAKVHFLDRAKAALDALREHDR